MNTLQQDTRRELFVRWVVANTVAHLVTYAVSLVMPGGPIAQFVSFGTFIVALGLAQWLALRPHFVQLSWRRWVIATTLGQILGTLLATIVFLVLYRFVPIFGLFSYLLLFALTQGAGSGLGIGVAQWRVLRHYFTATGERTWLQSNIVAQVVSTALPTFGTLAPDDLIKSLLTFVLGVAGGTLAGYITGRALLRLLAHT